MILEELIPSRLREKAKKKSRIAFKLPREKLVVIWKKYADPLRGTIIPLQESYLLVNYFEEGLIHVSDIVRPIFYPEPYPLLLHENRFRVLVRGVLYHELLKRYVEAEVEVDAEMVWEFPVTAVIGGYVIVGNIDTMIIFDDKCIVVEHKSSESTKTVEFGTLQVGIYARILREYYGFNNIEAYVLTPTSIYKIPRMPTIREIQRLIGLSIQIFKQEPHTL